MPGQECINPVRARQLRDGPPKCSYREVGILLAAEMGRSLAFQGGSIRTAIKVADGKIESGAQRYARHKREKANG